MRHNDSHRWGAITNDDLNYCLCITIFFSYNYLIVDGKRSFTNKKSSLKIYDINQRLKLWAPVPIAVSSCPAAAHMYR